MTTALLIVAALVDLALAALLIAVSGFVTGGGPESMNATDLQRRPIGPPLSFALPQPLPASS